MSTEFGHEMRAVLFRPFEHPARTMEEREVTEQKEERKCFLGNIFFVQFDKGVQRG